MKNSQNLIVYIKIEKFAHYCKSQRMIYDASANPSALFLPAHVRTCGTNKRERVLLWVINGRKMNQ
jgi:hypothetical protein